MNSKKHISDYYDILESDKDASFDDLKRNYQRLVLTSHPDKANKQLPQGKFHSIQEAWNVLRDPVTRKEYDAKLACQDHDELLLYETISLGDMCFDAEENCYSYACRCGGTYTIEACCTSNVSERIIDCDECSFSIKVILQSR